MTKWGKRLFSIAFSFMFLFISVGYAQLADTLVLHGTATITPQPEGVVITSVSLVSGGTATDVKHGYIWNTNVTSTISGTANQSVTYKVTVKNYSEYKYAYAGIKCETGSEVLEEYAGNSYYGKTNGLTIVTKNNPNDSVNTFGLGTAIEAGKTLTFYATYTLGSAIPSNEALAYMINYQFGLHVEAGGFVASEKVLQRFKQLLDTPADYDKLIASLGDVNGERYTANVPGAHDSSFTHNGVRYNTRDYITNLFGEDLKLPIVNENNVIEYRSVTCLIKTQNLDDDTSDNEMTIYMTFEEVIETTNRGETDYNYKTAKGDDIQVFAAVFKQGEDTKWHQLGDMYEGKARVNSYSGSWFSSANDSFNTDYWTPIQKEYAITERYVRDDVDIPAYSYTIEANTNYGPRNLAIAAIIKSTDTPYETQMEALLDEAYHILHNMNITGAGRDELLKIYNNAITYLNDIFPPNSGNGVTISGEGVHNIANNQYTRAQIVPEMSKLGKILKAISAQL